MTTPYIVRIPAQLSSLLRAARVQAGLTQADVARRLGVTTQAVSRLEKQAGKASFDRIHRLCAIVGFDIALIARAGAGLAAGHDGEW